MLGTAKKRKIVRQKSKKAFERISEVKKRQKVVFFEDPEKKSTLRSNNISKPIKNIILINNSKKY